MSGSSKKHSNCYALSALYYERGDKTIVFHTNQFLTETRILQDYQELFFGSGFLVCLLKKDHICLREILYPKLLYAQVN